MPFPNSHFEVVFKNSLGEGIAGIWRVDGVWKISTEPLIQFSSKAEALEAWETNFDHETGLPLFDM